MTELLPWHCPRTETLLPVHRLGDVREGVCPQHADQKGKLLLLPSFPHRLIICCIARSVLLNFFSSQQHLMST